MRVLLLLLQPLFLLLAISHAFAIQANLPSYDLIPITPKTWQEVNLSYSDKIKGKNYPAEIKLLRPIKWLKKNSMDKVGNNVNLSIPEFGVVNVQATVTAIKPTRLDTSKTDWLKIDSRPVIGTFKRYAPIVKTYTFRDVTTGEISTINATPNHPFYVKNKHEFIPIENVSSTDQLVNSSSQTIKLICDKGQSSHCGKLYNTDDKPIPVYNLEFYQKHKLYVGINKVLVHNNCEAIANADRKYLLQEYTKYGDYGIWGKTRLDNFDSSQIRLVYRAANENKEDAFTSGLFPANYTKDFQSYSLTKHIENSYLGNIFTSTSKEFEVGKKFLNNPSRNGLYVIFPNPKYSFDTSLGNYAINNVSEAEVSIIGKIPSSDIIGMYDTNISRYYSNPNFKIPLGFDFEDNENYLKSLIDTRGLFD